MHCFLHGSDAVISERMGYAYEENILANFQESFYCLFTLFFLSFPGPHPWHLKVPRLGVQSELQPPAYAIATATQDPSCVCDLHRSSRQRRILNPLSEARDQTFILMVTSQIRFHCTTTGTPQSPYF